MTETETEKRTILVTGSDGLIGWHFRAFLLTQPDVTVLPCNRAQFNDDAFLKNAIETSDVVVHLAGMNRGDEDEVAKTNVALADRIIEVCQSTSQTPHVVFSSSTHADGDSKYGISKRTAAEHFANWASEAGGSFHNLILPHVFGEHGKPFYNSVVSTFCHQLAVGETPEIQGDGQLNLLHAQDVSQIIWDNIQSQQPGGSRPQGTPLKVSELLSRLKRLVERYQAGTVPNLDDAMDHRLFNTWRSYLSHDSRPRELTLHADDRGNLFEAIRADGLGQVFVSTTHPGITRGNHFHTHKVERFLVVSGQAKIRVRKVLTDETHVFDVSGDKLQAIDIPTLHTHNITNVGDGPLLTLFWAGAHFDPDNSDTYFMPVEET